MFIKNYTEKMWQRTAGYRPELAFRVRLRLDNDKRLFTDVYQGVPSDGYTELIRRMLDHPNIRVELNTNYRVGPPSYRLLICTGPIDAYYNYRYGKLEYRGMRFEFVTNPGTEFNGFGTLNAPDDPRVLRFEEHKQYTRQTFPVTALGVQLCDGRERRAVLSRPDHGTEESGPSLSGSGRQRNQRRLCRHSGLYQSIDQHVAVREALDLFKRLP